MRALCILSLLLISSQARIINRITAADVTTILDELVTKDVNGGDQSEVVENFQNMASHTKFDHDNAPLPLFTSVSDRITNGVTFKAFEALLAFYNIPDTLTDDPNTPERTTAINSFLDTILATDVLKTAQEFLAKAGLCATDMAAFKKQLFDLWFTPYSRGSAVGSSGFETAFVGETHDGEVIGFNNWYRFYLLEQASKVNYHGWFNRAKGVQMELQFAWNEDKALMDSILLGSSPEFEMAAYTICALAKVEDCVFHKYGLEVDLTVKTNVVGGVTVIDSVYPIAGGGSSPTSATPTKKPGTKTTKKPKPSPVPAGKLQALIDAMWAADEDRSFGTVLNWGNPRSGTKDTSPEPLFTSVNETIFEKPQYKALIAMYEAKLFTADVCQAEPAMSGFRKQYITNVFDTFTSTPMFQLAFKYLQEVGTATDWESFRPKLWTLWMGTYSRCKSPLGSSGFEHVFLGEWKSTKVDGQHCWVQYYRLEKAGDINYHGYISHDEDLTGTFQYTWGKYLKNIGGFNIGTSPAFDFSAFTVCALTQGGGNACKFNLLGYPIAVTSYTQQCAEGTCLSTVYPAEV